MTADQALTLARLRATLANAQHRVDELEDRCECPRGCRCSMRLAILSAIREEEDASRALGEFYESLIEPKTETLRPAFWTA